MIRSLLLVLFLSTAAVLPWSSARADHAGACADFAVRAEQRIEACTTVIQSNNNKGPGLASTFRYRGFTYLQKDDFDHAIADFTEEIKLDPRNFDAYHFRAAAHASKGDLDMAIADLTEAIRLHPNDTNLLQGRINALLQKGDLDRAMADVVAIVRLRPDASALFQRGWMYHAKGELDRAIDDYSQAIRLDPKDGSFYSFYVLEARARAYRATGEFDRAAADEEAASRRCTSDSSCDKEIALSTQVIARYPNVWMNFAMRASAYRTKGDLGRAAADDAEARRLCPACVPPR